MDTEPPGIFNNIPFHVDVSKYSPAELEILRSFFMDSNFPSFTLRISQRDSAMRFENFPIAEKNEEFQDVMQKSVQDLMAECHPLLKRRGIVVRFVSNINETLQGKVFSPGAECLDAEVDGEKMYWIRALKGDINEFDDENIIPTLVFRVLHEIAETDYYLKSPEGTIDPITDPNSPEYLFFEDEEIVNRRVFRILKKYYPEVHFPDIDYQDL